MRTYRAGAMDNARPEPSALRSTSGRCGSHRQAARAARVSGGTEGVNPLPTPGISARGRLRGGPSVRSRWAPSEAWEAPAGVPEPPRHARSGPRALVAPFSPSANFSSPEAQDPKMPEKSIQNR